MLKLLTRPLLLVSLLLSAPAWAQGAATAPGAPVDETALGVIPVTGSTSEHVVKLAILPSLSPDLEDVVVRGVVRRDMELSGMFDVIPDARAPLGDYGFGDPVDIAAWKKLGAEVIIKVAAHKHDGKAIEIHALAYLLSVGQSPVYEKTLSVDPSQVRVTAHRVTDALLGAITGRNGGFASRMTYSGKWGRVRRIFTMDADGHDLAPRSPEKDTAIAPAWGPGGTLWYSLSMSYSPYLAIKGETDPRVLPLPFATSVYSVAFDRTYTHMAIAVAEKGGSAVYTGNADGSDLKKVSTTEIATHPVWSPSGKLAWVGGGNKQGTQRVYVDGKPASPSGFAASSPTFCDTEDGIRLVFTVSVGSDRQDLVMTNEKGAGATRLTQNQGTNTSPACSVDGRLLAFFSTRKSGAGPGMYMMSLKRWTAQRVSSQLGESLRWAPLP